MGSKRRKKMKTAAPTMELRRTEEMRYLGLGEKTATTASNTTSQTPTEPTGVTDARMATTDALPAAKAHSTHVPTTNSSSTHFTATNFSATKTNPANRPPLRTVISHAPYKPARRVDTSADAESSKTEWWLGPALVLGAAVMMGLGWLHIQRSNLVAHPVGHPSKFARETVDRELESKVKFYRSQLGHKLNRDRMGVEIENSISAPKIGTLVSRPVDPAIMAGVPLMQESYIQQTYGPSSKKQTMPVDHPDARIQYGLQDRDDQREYDRRVEAEYVREFVENARRDGVKVTLDKDHNVIDVEPLPGRGRRQPGSFDQGSTR